MGCGCKKKEQVVVTPLPIVEEPPKTPDEQLTRDLNNWNGGINTEESNPNGRVR